MKDLPFQVQILFTKLDGMKCVRVITKLQPVTFDKQVAEAKANIAVLGMNAVQQSAKLASKGKYSDARMYNLANKQALSRAAKTPQQQHQLKKWAAYGQDFETELSRVQKREIETLGDLDEAEEEVEAKEKDTKSVFSFLSKKKAEVNKLRRNQREDTTATMLYKMKSADTNKFK